MLLICQGFCTDSATRTKQHHHHHHHHPAHARLDHTSLSSQPSGKIASAAFPTTGTSTRSDIGLFPITHGTIVYTTRHWRSLGNIHHQKRLYITNAWVGASLHGPEQPIDPLPGYACQIDASKWLGNTEHDDKTLEKDVRTTCDRTGLSRESLEMSYIAEGKARMNNGIPDICNAMPSKLAPKTRPKGMVHVQDQRCETSSTFPFLFLS